MSFMYRKHDPLMSYFDRVISILHQAGIVDKFFRSWMPHEGMKENVIEAEKKLTAEHFLIPCIVAIGGILVSLLSLAVEKMANTLEKPCVILC